ncbi:GNAT family N-acetyltransferase [Arenimonas sp. MALMAid1274]|uniref:GNAT family N-acetyltransferase n=1 Tax=Arenimonas sp. MALMAid1274 TaxID=3411630 RepID=UPI003BA25958
MNAVRVRFLAEVPGHASTLARWHHAQWSGLYEDWSLQQATDELRDHATRRTLPTTLVAMDGDALLGSVSLVEEDAPELRDQGDAWLASLYVVPAARGQGLGQRLVRALVAHAAAQQVARLWLFTPEHAAFYARLGWRPQGSAKLRGVPVQLMDILPA